MYDFDLVRDYGLTVTFITYHNATMYHTYLDASLAKLQVELSLILPYKMMRFCVVSAALSASFCFSIHFRHASICFRSTCMKQESGKININVF